jgi:WD40 repeat protein
MSVLAWKHAAAYLGWQRLRPLTGWLAGGLLLVSTCGSLRAADDQPTLWITSLAPAADAGGFYATEATGLLLRSGTLYRGQFAQPDQLTPVLESSTSLWKVQPTGDGRRLALAEYSGELTLLDSADVEQRLGVEPRPRWSRAAATLPDGRLVVGTEDGGLLIIDPQSGAIVSERRGTASALYSIAVSPCGERLATVAADGSLAIWDLSAEQPLGTLQVSSLGLWSVLFGVDSDQLLAAGADRRVHLLSVAEVLAPPPAEPEVAAEEAAPPEEAPPEEAPAEEAPAEEAAAEQPPAADGEAATEEGQEAQDDAEQELPIVQEPLPAWPILTGPTDWITSLAWLDEGVLAAGSLDGGVYVYDVTRQQGLGRLDGPGSPIWCLLVDNNSGTILVGTRRHGVQSLAVEAWRELVAQAPREVSPEPAAESEASEEREEAQESEASGEPEVSDASGEPGKS